jgi:hypothetical protein
MSVSQCLQNIEEKVTEGAFGMLVLIMAFGTAIGKSVKHPTDRH